MKNKNRHFPKEMAGCVGSAEDNDFFVVRQNRSRRGANIVSFPPHLD
ncbi:MAG: hypothetical protein NTX55_00055 [Candidatus Parcubacteria bacterium]|nr:hypothetical protein [Candidatus Parcubacteria bacterium]